MFYRCSLFNTNCHNCILITHLQGCTYQLETNLFYTLFLHCCPTETISGARHIVSRCSPIKHCVCPTCVNTDGEWLMMLYVSYINNVLIYQMTLHSPDSVIVAEVSPCSKINQPNPPSYPSGRSSNNVIIFRVRCSSLKENCN